MFTRRWASLDIPMSSWIELSDGKLQFIRKNFQKYPATLKDRDAWDDLYNLYIQEFGHNKEFLKIKKHEHNIAKLQLQYITDADKYRFNKTLISIEKNNIEEIKRGMMSGMTIREANVYVSKFVGGGIIDLKKISVIDYFTILKEYGKENRKK